MSFSRFVPFLVVAVLCIGCKEADREQTPAGPPTYRNLDAQASYVGKEVCQGCHPTQYDTFIQSEMGRSFKKASLSISDADFEGAAPVYDPHKDLYYQAFHQGEDLFVKEFRLAGRDTVFARVEQIDYIVGSGQHTNSHIMEENGYLYQMPLTWYTQDGLWDLPPGFEDGNNSRFSRPIPVQCMTCHNAMPVFVPGSENRYAEVPHGIDCERCHGPGSVHVQEKQAGKVVDITKEIDYSIVNPRKLPIDLQFDICQRCHMQGAAVYREGLSPMDFRPGMALADVENVFWPREADSLEQFIMASHPNRLKMSQCFLQSHDEANGYEPLTCITCHNPHVSIKTLGPEYYNQTCQSCHDPAEVTNPGLCTEEEAVRAAQADNCVACHMPVSGSSDIPHVRITDHLIRVQKEDEGEVLTAAEVAAHEDFFGLASLIDQSPTTTDIARGYLAYYEEVTDRPDFLDSAAVFLTRARDEAPSHEWAPPQIQVLFWKEDYPAIARLASTLNEATIQDPWTFYRIGEAYSRMGSPQQAIRYFEQAVNLAPEHLRFQTKLATAYSNDGQLDMALSLFDTILDANPKYDEAYNNRGFTRVLLGDAEGAEADLLMALSLDPDAIYPLANLASLYFNTDRRDEARPHIKRLLELDPMNPDYQQLWNLVN